jgi:hypothetical protein
MCLVQVLEHEAQYDATGEVMKVATVSALALCRLLQHLPHFNYTKGTKIVVWSLGWFECFSFCMACFPRLVECVSLGYGA